MTEFDIPAPFIRPRRNRRTAAIRNMVAETRFAVDQLIVPLFIVPGKGVRDEIPSMPGVYQLSVDEAAKDIAACWDLGLTSYLLFGIPTYKDAEGSSAWQDDGIIQLALKRFTKDFPEAHFIADLCFCEYTEHGHCGVVDENGVDNDATLINLGRQAVSLAKAGVHTVAPSGSVNSNTRCPLGEYCSR